MTVFLGYFPWAPPNPHLILPFPIVSWRLPITNSTMGSFAPAFCFGGHCEEWEMSEMIIIPSLLCCHPFMVQ